MVGRRRRLLKHTAAEAEQFRRRALLAFVGVVLALGGLSLWYFRLQVWQYDDYALRSEQNRVKLRPVVPGRGLIYDREGRILADNVPAFRLEVTPNEAGDPKDWLPALAQVVALTEEEIAAFHDARKAGRGFKPVPLKMRLTPQEVARLAVDRWRYPGVEVVSYLNRRYLHGPLLAHVVGYVSRVDAGDVQAMGEDIANFSHTGKTGLERSYEEALRGRIGYERVETNVDGRPLGLLGRVPAVPGADLRLSIDLDLQRAMVAAFGDADGSAVAIDPATGQVLAMVSKPSYDTNLFVNGISHQDYNALLNNPSRPLYNRNVLGGGPPGSTVKPMVGLAGLDSGLREADDRTLSTGEFFIAGQRRGYRDSHAGGHGWVDLRQSIAQSVNTYYSKLAQEMGIDTLAMYMHRYGFGEKTGIDLLGENEGVVPSRDYKRSISTEPWYPGETVISGIGQGYWIATALQLVQEGMEMTVNGPRGTARAIGVGAPYRIAGKTGTAQRSSRKGNISHDPHSLPYNLRHTALFVGYAPADAPKIAVAVVVEHGGFGSTSAAPIARKVFDAWLLGKMPEGIENVEKTATVADFSTVAATASSTAEPAEEPGVEPAP